MFKFIYKFFHKHYHRHYHGVYKNPKKLFIFDLFLLSTAIVMLGASLFFFFWKPGITDLIDLKISLGDTRIKSGEPVHLSVHYTNRSTFALTHPSLAVHLPDGFIIDRAKTPENIFSADSILTLEDIKPGAKGQADIYGTLFAEPKSDERILATLSYQTEKSSATEQKFASFFVTLPASVLEDTLTIATTTFAGQALPFTYTLKNTGASPVDGISLEDTWTPALLSDAANKSITLAPSETKTVTGTLKAPGAAGDYTVVIRSKIIANNQPIIQSIQQKTISVFVPSVSSEIKLLQQVPYIEPNQTLPAEISWKNTSSLTLSQLRIKITPTPGIIDISKTARENQLKIENGSLIIDSSRRTALATAAPGAGDTTTITFYLLPTFTASGNAPRLSIIPSVEGGTAGFNGQQFSAPGASVSLPLATDLTLTTETRYYTPEGDQLGRGPLPPEVGQSTKYWIFVELFNTINSVEKNNLIITLSPGVTFTGKQSVTLGSPLSASGQNLTWSLHEIPPNTKTGWYFEVETTPTEAMIGKSISLIRNISFSGSDTVVSKDFNLSSGAITNALRANDRGSKSGSKVIQP